MEFKEYIQARFWKLVDEYEDNKHKKSRMINTILQSYNISVSTHINKIMLQTEMIKAVNQQLTRLKNKKQKDKFILDNAPIESNYLENMLTESTLLDICSLIEGTLLESNYIFECVKNKNEFESLGEVEFQKKCKNKATKNFEKKYKAIEDMCIYADINDIFDEFEELKQSKEIFKYIFFIRNCLVHSGGIVQDYVIKQQEIVEDELRKLGLAIFNENDKIVFGINQLNSMIFELRQISELIVISIYNKLEEHLDETSECKFNDYIDMLIID